VNFFLVFAEEFFYRGFMQTRLERFFGMTNGLLLTAIWFDLVHIPGWVSDFGATYQDAVIFAVLTIPVSITFGYIAQKSNNLLGSTIFHLIYDMTFP
jgi:membrane protease YdiL (CAAX protease family)